VPGDQLHVRLGKLSRGFLWRHRPA
jgi:hypothetical protein